MTRPLQVGIIGVSVDRGWAKESHVPAVQRLGGLELAAVVTSNQATASAAAQAFGAKTGFGNAEELFRDREIDIVSICVKAPDHLKLLLGALAAGKHVYCEWPLGRNLAEAGEIEAAAREAGVHAAVGLQTRGNPAAIRARDLIRSGAIGRTLSARIYSPTVAFGPKLPAAEAYLNKAENGVTLVSIQGSHTLDFALFVLGPVLDFSAMTTVQYPAVQIGDDPHLQPRTIPDHLLLQSRLADGAALSLEVAGGRPPETPFRFEVTGEQGVLALEGGAPRGFQSGRLSLSLNGKPQEVDEGETGGMPDTAANVAGIYAALRDDIVRGTYTAPSFDHAVQLARLIDDIMSSATEGTRKFPADPPNHQ